MKEIEIEMTEVERARLFSPVSVQPRLTFSRKSGLWFFVFVLLNA